jgi:benzoyl-CoA reductase subunit D
VPVSIGADAGARFLKLVVVGDSGILACAEAECGIELDKVAEFLLGDVLAKAGVSRDAVGAINATGVGAEAVPFATARMNIVRAMARGAVALVPGARTVVEVGAEEARVVVLDEKGNLLDFAMNDKCAAGAGSWVDAMARALEVKAGALAAMAAKARKAAPMNSQCVVFAESEVVSMIHRNIPREEIARSVYDAMASRILPLLKKLHASPPMVATGGMAKDAGFVEALSQALGARMKVPADPQYACALGAALSTGKS